MVYLQKRKSAIDQLPFRFYTDYSGGGNGWGNTELEEIDSYVTVEINGSRITYSGGPRTAKLGDEIYIKCRSGGMSSGGGTNITIFGETVKQTSGNNRSIEYTWIVNKVFTAMSISMEKSYYGSYRSECTIY